jgi:hypothetical protein
MSKPDDRTPPQPVPTSRDHEAALAALEREFEELVERMQQPGQRAVADAFFEMSGEELGALSRDHASRVVIERSDGADHGAGE